MTPQQIRNAIFLSIGVASLQLGCADKKDTDTDTDPQLASIPAGDYPECTGEGNEYAGY